MVAFSDLMKASDPGKPPAEAKGSGPGKRSSDSMQASDNHFIAMTEFHLCSALDKFNVQHVPAATAEDDVIQHFKKCNKDMTDSHTKLTAKLNNLKRRKLSAADAAGQASHQEMIRAVENLRFTMSVFANIYQELGSATLNAGELKRYLDMAMQAGYKFEAGVSFRLVKALVLDSMRFAQYPVPCLYSYPGPWSCLLPARLVVIR